MATRAAQRIFRICTAFTAALPLAHRHFLALLIRSVLNDDKKVGVGGGVVD